jgi:predicted acetyltransferase
MLKEMNYEYYLKKSELDEPVEIFNLVQEMVDEKWLPIKTITPEGFAEYLKKLHDEDLGIDLEDVGVPQTTYWFYTGREPCGMLLIRRLMNETILKNEGQIAYYIKKSYRQKGYGKKILSSCLDLLRREEVDRILITCNSRNIVSKKIIENNMGIFENIVDGVRRYWIEL